MTCELTRRDLWRLLKGTEPPMEWISRLEELQLGHYHGGFNEGFSYNVFPPENLSEEQMWDLYQQMSKGYNLFWERIENLYK